MTASEARELSLAYSKFNEVVDQIVSACKKGEASIKTYFTKDSGKARSLLVEAGYALKDIVDEDSDYRGTTISW